MQASKFDTRGPAAVSDTRGLAGGAAVGLGARVNASQLTPTQIKVLRGVHSGLLNKQIAFNLGIAEATVKVHMTALMRKLNVRNRTQAAILAQSMAIEAS